MFSVRILATLVAVSALVCLPSHGNSLAPEQEDARLSGSQGDMPIAFDISDQPLDVALKIYAQQADRSLLYETRQMRGKRASPVQGSYDADAALVMLLTGTGMRIKRLPSGMTAITAATAPVNPAQKSKAPADRQDMLAAGIAQENRLYHDGYLQHSIYRLLCSRPDLQADRQRIVLRFSVNATRRIEDLHVRVAAAPAIEDGVRAVLASARLTPPPAGVAQPVLMLLSPDMASRWGGCQP